MCISRKDGPLQPLARRWGGAAGDASSASSVARFSCRMAAAARGPPAASPHASDTHFRRLLLNALICCCVSHRLVFTDEEGIDAIGNLLFGFLAADLMQFSGQRGVHAEARGEARLAYPREHLEALSLIHISEPTRPY